MVTRFRSINPIQLAIVSAVLYALVGILIALFFLAFSSMAASVMPYGTARGMFGGGVFMAIFIPIIEGVAGFVGGLIVGVLYNLVAGWTGGIEVTLESVATPAPVTAADVALRQ
jgi:hypothetical protein